MEDRFGESGEPYELMKYFNFTSDGIINKVKQVIKRKK